MAGTLDFVGNHFFDVASILISAGALFYAMLAFRVANRAVLAAEASDLASLRLKAQEGRANAEKSLLLLQAACSDMRSQWTQHHVRHFPTLGARDYRLDDTRHISEVASEGRQLLSALDLELSEIGEMNADALEGYIRRADGTAISIERLVFKLSSPKQLFA